MSYWTLGDLSVVPPDVLADDATRRSARRIDMDKFTSNRCVECGSVICKARREALPDTNVCVACSKVKAKTVYDVEIDAPCGLELVKACTNQGD